MIDILRHKTIFNPIKYRGLPITIIGAGATGSRVFMALVELGLQNITVIDFDHVEQHNLANQIFDADDIGHPKADACIKHGLRKVYGANSDDAVKGWVAKNANALDEDIKLSGIVFLLTDSMESRRKIYDEKIKDNPAILAVIETRMAATHGNVFTFNPASAEDSKSWLNSLIDDDTAEVSACGASISVGTTASIIANMATWQFMTLLTMPEAVDNQVDIFMRPFCVSTSKEITHHG